MSGHYVGKKCKCQFEIPDLSDINQLRVTVKKPGSNTEEPVTAEKGPGKSVLVSFVPDKPGDHQLSMFLSGLHVSGSPFNIPVKGGVATGNTMSFSLELQGYNLPADFKLLTAKLQRPGENDAKDDLELSLIPDNTVSMTFVPLVSGEHLVYIYKEGREISGSPFSVRAKGPTPPDPSKVKVIGDGIRRGISGELGKFIVDARDAGSGGLKCSVEGPSKPELNCITKDDGTFEVEFLPKAPGVYTIFVKYADQPIPGSPFICAVAEADDELPDEIPPPIVREAPADITRHEFIVKSSRPASHQHQSPAQKRHGLEVDLTGYIISELSANVETPTGKVEEAKIVKKTRDTYTVTFITRNGGTHKVNVMYNRKHIPGSPFFVDVDTANWQLTSKAKVTGPKDTTGKVGEPCEYVLSTRESGGGNLGLTVEGPVRAEIYIDPTGNDEYKIHFTPTAPGDYVIHMRFADQDIFKSLVFVPEEPDANGGGPKPTELTNKNVNVGMQFTLQVPFKGSVDQLTYDVITPSGSKIPATVAKIDDEMFGVTFIPQEAGDYLIYIFLNGKPFSGSPFKLIVGTRKVDPSKLRISGPGLKEASVGKKTSFTVDPRDAGSAKLAIDAKGPSKLDFQFEQQAEGIYIVSYIPSVSGNYDISIKFDGENVPNSRFCIKVSPEPGKSYN